MAMAFPMYSGYRQKAIDAVNKENISIAIHEASVAYIDGAYTDSFTTKGGVTWKITRRNGNNTPFYLRYKIGKKHRGAFYYFLDDNCFGYQSKAYSDRNKFVYDLTLEKVNGIYRNILVDVYEDKNGDLVVKTKPYIDDKGDVRYAFGVMGEPFEQADSSSIPGRYSSCEEIEEAYNTDIRRH